MQGWGRQGRPDPEPVELEERWGRGARDEKREGGVGWCWWSVLPPMIAGATPEITPSVSGPCVRAGCLPRVNKQRRRSPQRWVQVSGFQTFPELGPSPLQLKANPIPPPPTPGPCPSLNAGPGRAAAPPCPPTGSQLASAKGAGKV